MVLWELGRGDLLHVLSGHMVLPANRSSWISSGTMSPVPGLWGRVPSSRMLGELLLATCYYIVLESSAHSSVLSSQASEGHRLHLTHGILCA
jgi:hypothetical protein